VDEDDRVRALRFRAHGALLAILVVLLAMARVTDRLQIGRRIECAPNRIFDMMDLANRVGLAFLADAPCTFYRNTACNLVERLRPICVIRLVMLPH